ncbi:hypothetical protein Lepto7375DRAFT_0089 [Leptolyngbya sp. PCC 7375]|nr:hypothetical protein Lepto7375DRAFT_0089 [Leptolyngbya sp. PCC 7375]
MNSEFDFEQLKAEFELDENLIDVQVEEVIDWNDEGFDEHETEGENASAANHPATKIAFSSLGMLGLIVLLSKLFGFGSIDLFQQATEPDVTEDVTVSESDSVEAEAQAQLERIIFERENQAAQEEHPADLETASDSSNSSLEDEIAQAPEPDTQAKTHVESPLSSDNGVSHPIEPSYRSTPTASSWTSPVSTPPPPRAPIELVTVASPPPPSSPVPIAEPLLESPGAPMPVASIIEQPEVMPAIEEPLPPLVVQEDMMPAVPEELILRAGTRFNIVMPDDIVQIDGIEQQPIPQQFAITLHHEDSELAAELIAVPLIEASGLMRLANTRLVIGDEEMPLGEVAVIDQVGRPIIAHQIVADSVELASTLGIDIASALRDVAVETIQAEMTPDTGSDLADEMLGRLIGEITDQTLPEVETPRDTAPRVAVVPAQTSATVVLPETVIIPLPAQESSEVAYVAPVEAVPNVPIPKVVEPLSTPLPPPPLPEVDTPVVSHPELVPPTELQTVRPTFSTGHQPRVSAPSVTELPQESPSLSRRIPCAQRQQPPSLQCLQEGVLIRREQLPDVTHLQQTAPAFAGSQRPLSLSRVKSMPISVDVPYQISP